jgi:hypothetical protein
MNKQASNLMPRLKGKTEVAKDGYTELKAFARLQGRLKKARATSNRKAGS